MTFPDENQRVSFGADPIGQPADHSESAKNTDETGEGEAMEDGEEGTAGTEEEEGQGDEPQSSTEKGEERKKGGGGRDSRRSSKNRRVNTKDGGGGGVGGDAAGGKLKGGDKAGVVEKAVVAAGPQTKPWLDMLVPMFLMYVRECYGETVDDHNAAAMAVSLPRVSFMFIFSMFITSTFIGTFLFPFRIEEAERMMMMR